ncbi:plasmid pRiA4b ORF-3 family protein [Aliidiomarina sanyensis]|uniref:plasmid pRiA4b ORF-3 family protein n=1 Tax=Aliidiomarina sanyensis TaxID=1249555 RepID=UPI0013005A5A|nr:plasmid pRiA4b ORF-3 family protein [Aliidiomarina sanyensis]
MSHYATILISLEDAPVPVERILQIPADFTLDFVHMFLQEAMGWRDEHFYCFHTPLGSIYPDTDDLLGEATSNLLDHEVTLRDVLPEVGACIHYVYDFGDNWTHLIQLLEWVPEDEGLTQVLSASGRCPPENAGGVFGYEEILKTLGSAGNDESKQGIIEWLGVSEWDPMDPQLELLQLNLNDLIEEIFSQADQLPDEDVAAQFITHDEDYELPGLLHEFLARPYDAPEFLEIVIPDGHAALPITHVLAPTFLALRDRSVPRAPAFEREIAPTDILTQPLQLEEHALGILECTDLVTVDKGSLTLSKRGKQVLPQAASTELTLALLRAGLGAYNWARFGGHSDIPAIQFSFPLVLWKICETEDWTPLHAYTDYLAQLIPDIYFECQSPFMGPITELLETYLRRMTLVAELFGLVELRKEAEPTEAEIRPGPNAHWLQWHL